MATAITVKEKIQGLINKSNNITGNSNTTLTDAVNALAEGYGGEATLIELTVTENGVYDNPMIVEAPVIEHGATLTFKEYPAVEDVHESMRDYLNQPYPIYEDPDGWYCDISNSAGFMVRLNNEQLSASFIYFDNVRAEKVGVAEAGWYDNSSGSPVKLDTPPSFTIHEVFVIEEYTPLVLCKNLFQGKSTHANGWNKVMVDVPVNETAVLTELTVTENGTYDNPVIEEPPVLEAGQTITFKSQIKIEDLPDGMLDYMRNWWTVFTEPRSGAFEVLFRHVNKEDSHGFFLQYTINGNYYYYFDEMAVSLFGDGEGVPFAAGWYSGTYEGADVNMPIEAPSITFVIDPVSEYPDYLGFVQAAFVGTSVPVDGWNKVIVDVEPKLAELVITENGVYDKPSIPGKVIIEPGSTLTFKSEIKTEDIPADHLSPNGQYTIFSYGGDYDIDFRCLPCNGSYGFWIILDDRRTEEDKVFMDAVFTNCYGDGTTAPLEAGWYMSNDYSTKVTPPTINIPDDIIVNDYDYFFNNWMLFEAPAIPVDGWNKVTVDVQPDPVLAELIATENGIYENPVIEEPPVIAIGETLTFKDIIELDDIPRDISQHGNEHLIYGDANGEEWLVRRYLPDVYPDSVIDIMVYNYNTMAYYLGEKAASTKANECTGINGAGWYNIDEATSTATKLDAPPSFTILEESSFNDGFLQRMPNIFKGTSTPADGWNKVTVNVEAEPVLGELVVTENGTYENPTIEGEPVIDYGCTLTFKPKIMFGVDIPADIFDRYGSRQEGFITALDEASTPSATWFGTLLKATHEGNTGFVIIADREPNNLDTGISYQYADDVAALANTESFPDGAGWYAANTDDYIPIKIDTPPTIPNVDGDMEILPELKGMFQAPLTPADGWNKVTVNVPVGEPHVPNMVPNDGSYVHNIYFNTTLYIEDDLPDRIIAEINKIPDEYWIQDGENGLICPVFRGDSDFAWPTYALIKKGYYSNVTSEPMCVIDMVTKGEGSDPGGLRIEIGEYLENGETHYVWGDFSISSEEGCFLINSDTYTQSEVVGPTDKIGRANHLLTNLFSIRPFN